MSACGLEDIVCTSSSPENFAGSFNKNARNDLPFGYARTL
jgi:hypothetical protein